MTPDSEINIFRSLDFIRERPRLIRVVPSRRRPFGWCRVNGSHRIGVARSQ